MEDMSDVIQEFLLESFEGLDRMERELMDYEKNPADRERLMALFRVLHTLKGTGGFLGFARMEKLAHSGENVLVLLRDGKIPMTSQLATLLLELVDVLRLGLRRVEAGQGEGEGNDGALLEKLQLAAENSPNIGKGPAATPPKEDEPFHPVSPPMGSKEPAPSLSKDPVPAPSTGSAEPTLSLSKGSPQANSGQAGSTGSPQAGGGMEENVLRVQAGLLDHLMNLTGEMVLARNQAIQSTAAQSDPAFAAALQPMNQLALKIQEGVMKARLQPISQLWSRFPRLVRETALACGKKVTLETQGAETEIDRGILEAIRDPLTHLIRNAVDHGLESPEQRAQAGKPPQGHVTLRASHEAGAVHIEVKDDGGGLPLERIKQKAVEQGLITPEQAERLQPDEAAQLIFRQGFSTADKLTTLSGRGVGLDVVKTNLEKIGGKVEVTSQAGRGTSFKLKIPLTLTSLPALVVSCGGQKFILPRAHLREIIRVKDAYVHRGVEYLPETAVYRLREKLIPLVFLRKELGLAPADESLSYHIAVLKLENRTFGLVLDEVVDFLEVMVKPLGRHLKSIPFYLGTTVLGDGQVALILDIIGLAQRCGLEADPGSGEPELATVPPEQTQLTLIFQTHDGGRMALSLDKILRLEVFRRSAVERAGDREVIQYEGKILPLIQVSRFLSGKGQVLQAPDPGLEEKIQVVIYDNGREEVGLVVDRVLDILTTSLEAQLTVGRPGVKGSLILENRVTELLDIPAILGTLGAGIAPERGISHAS